MTPELKMSRAMTRLVLSHPFYGSIALGADVHRDDSVQTGCTNGKWIKWGSDFVDRLTEAKTLGLLAHEVLHIALKHMLRMGKRDRQKWNIACDAAINIILRDDGFELPDGGIDMPQFRDMSVEKIYDLLPDDIVPPAWGAFVLDDLSPEDMKEMDTSITQRVILAAHTAKGIGKLPAWAGKMIEEMQEPQVNFEDALRRFFAGDQPDDYSMRRPNRRMYHVSGIIAPSTDRKGVGNIVCYIDSSGSVLDKQLSHFLGEMNAISDEMHPASITVICCDTSVYSVTRYEAGESITAVSAKYRGGTLVSPVFDYIEREGLEVDHFVGLTDLEIADFPREAPEYPVLWVSCGRKTAPFGQVVTINTRH